ncbi:hypothetical protein BH10PSE7_BH10PSE7_14890 [soil metagenome]
MAGAPSRQYRGPTGPYMVLSPTADEEDGTFGPGSIVRCHPTRFGDGTQGMVAIPGLN